MEVPKTLAEALSALDAARVDAAAFDALTVEHTAQLAAHAQLAERFNTLSAQFDALKLRANGMAAELDAERAKQATAAQQANTALASLGVEPVAITPESPTATKSELWAQYNALSLVERNAFYAKHKDTLTK